MGPNVNSTGFKSYVASGTIAAFDRVKISSSSGGFNAVAAAGLGEPGIGIAQSSASSGDPVTVKLWTAPGTHQIKASKSISLGADVFCAASGKFTDSPTAAGDALGVAEQSASGDGAYIEMALRPQDGLQGGIVAAGTALTASSTQTALATHSIPANRLKAGSRIRFFAQAIATATNSTDTLTLRISLGGLANVVFATAAIDVANNDIGVITGEIVVRTAGASGTMVGAGLGSLGVPTTGTARGSSMASTTLDTTAANSLVLSGQWSTTDPGNSCRADIFSFEIID